MADSSAIAAVPVWFKSTSTRSTPPCDHSGVPCEDDTKKAGSGPPDPVSRLGLPNYNPGTLSRDETRTVYAQGELRMRQLNEQLISQGMSPEERARIMFDQRNALRTWTRELMADRALAAQVSSENPNLTWDQVLAKYQAKGVEGDTLWNSIIGSSTRSRPSVNAALGIDPENPPPLPPVRPPPLDAPAVEPPPPAPPVSRPEIGGGGGPGAGFATGGGGGAAGGYMGAGGHMEPMPGVEPP